MHYALKMRFALSIVLTAVLIGAAQTSDNVQILLPDQTLDRELTGAEIHRYKIDLKANEFFQARVEQKGVNVVLRLIDESGAALAAMDSLNGKEGPETLSFVAGKAGELILEVSGFDPKAAKGAYAIHRQASRTATANDSARVAVEKLFVEAMDSADADAAIKKFEETLPGWRALQDEYLIQLTTRTINLLKLARTKTIMQAASDLFDQGTSASYKTALNKFQEAGRLYEEINYHGIDAGTPWLASGLISVRLGERAAALKFYEKALIFFQANNYKNSEATALNILGSVYDDSGDSLKALDFYNRSLLLKRQIKDSSGEAPLLSAIGAVYNSTGERQKALDHYNQALLLYRQAGDKAGEVKVLNSLGLIYSSLGEKQKSFDLFSQALPLSRGDKQNEAATLNNLGLASESLGDNPKALGYFNQALPIYRQSGNKSGEATTLSNIGVIYSSFGEKPKALEFYNQALLLRREIGDKRGEATTLTDIGIVYDDLGEKETALKYLQASLPLSKAVGDKEIQSNTLDWLMHYWASLKNPQFAVFYGKQSVNLLQELRTNIQGLDKETRNTYLKSVEDTYRRLAGILINQGRIAEAEQVLGMLKEEEYLSYLRGGDSVAADLKGRISLSADEKQAFADYEKFAGEITRAAEDFGALEKKKNALALGLSLSAEDQKQYEALKTKYDAAVTVFNKYLDDLKVRFAGKGEQYAQTIAVESDTQGILKRLNQPHTVIISTIAGEDRLDLIVTTSDIQKAHTVRIKEADLNKLVADFREAVRDPRIDPRPLGKKLYDVLFPAELQKDLENIKADTIVWSLDGALRYVPMAALWDGEKYLIERYTNAVLTLASRDKLNSTVAADRRKWLALGVGVSKPFEDFNALPAVPQELCSVIDDAKKKDFCRANGETKGGAVKGLLLADEEFTLAGFQNNLGKTAIVHIASHFSLNAGNEIDSYLLLGGGDPRRFSLDNLRKTRLDSVELLTLSACNTAMSAGANSSGVEIEGFGALAQKQGAKTVLASLWAVSDDSTRDLMTEFYRILETDQSIGKAEALRQAQLELLQGSPKIRRSKSFAHPYFWSPFILIGNWR